ncbi:MAG: histidine--tRNA ligase [Holosporales bacterium]|jgi:histidyl-tRNA synthetase|nr:histidine--tRNA ligase [Holosporales bacterium]
MMFRPVRGMKDLYGTDIRKYNYIINKAVQIGEKYGYSIINTPILEYTDVFVRAIGDETDIVSKEMYTFLDKGGESITLRPEGTAGIMRAIVTESMTQSLPVKLMYYGEMFRYDRPQKGRYRQFHQLGCEHVGDKSPYTDAITIALAVEILNSIGIFDFKVLINTLGDTKTREDYTKGLVKYLSRHEGDLSEDSKRRLVKNPLRILDSKDKKDREICLMSPVITDYLSKESLTYFEKVCSLLSKFGVNYEVNNFLVRGLDYYTHTTFEFKPVSGEYREALGGGGRYDNLLSAFKGADVSGIGFAIGIERLMLLLEDNKFLPVSKKVAVIPVSENENDTSFDLLKTLYSCEIEAEFLHMGTITKKLKVANRLQCKLALIVGETEFKNGTVTVKFMNQEDSSLKTKLITRDDVVNFIKCNL